MVVGSVLNIVGVFTEEEIHWVNLVVGFVLAVLWTVIVFWLVVPRAERTPGRAAWTGIVCGLLGAVAVVAFWSLLPPVLAMAAVFLGLAARRAGRRAGVAAVVLGVVALALDVVAYATDVASRV